MTEPRAVSHWIYFKTEKDRDTFPEKISASGFKAVDKSKSEDSNADYPFGVTIDRIDHVDWDSINKVTIELFRIARQTDGDYDGWETSIETPVPQDTEEA